MVRQHIIAATIAVISSANGTLIHTPVSPIVLDRINTNGNGIAKPRNKERINEDNVLPVPAMNDITAILTPVTTNAKQ